jgi:hypothetical protein
VVKRGGECVLGRERGQIPTWKGNAQMAAWDFGLMSGVKRKNQNLE